MITQQNYNNKSKKQLWDNFYVPIEKDCNSKKIDNCYFQKNYYKKIKLEKRSKSNTDLINRVDNNEYEIIKFINFLKEIGIKENKYLFNIARDLVLIGYDVETIKSMLKNHIHSDLRENLLERCNWLPSLYDKLFTKYSEYEKEKMKQELKIKIPEIKNFIDESRNLFISHNSSSYPKDKFNEYMDKTSKHLEFIVHAMTIVNYWEVTELNIYKNHLEVLLGLISEKYNKNIREYVYTKNDMDYFK